MAQPLHILETMIGIQISASMSTTVSRVTTMVVRKRKLLMYIFNAKPYRSRPLLLLRNLPQAT